MRRLNMKYLETDKLIPVHTQRRADAATVGGAHARTAIARMRRIVLSQQLAAAGYLAPIYTGPSHPI